MTVIYSTFKGIFCAVIFVLLTTYSAYPQYLNSNTTGFTAKTVTYLASHPREKVYLQSDKDFYLAGDTLYFKAYLTLGEKNYLSALSTVLHVKLINPKNQTTRSINLLLRNGIASGDFDLRKDLTGGNYHLEAYTQWMKNNGTSSFFDRTIPVHALKKPQSNSSKVTDPGNDADVQFLPEGGNLVNGIRTKVAFKAVGKNGLGLDVKGTVSDDKGNFITDFSSSHLGMGFFFLKPDSGKSYKAAITLNHISKKIFDIQASSEDGISLSVDNDSLPKAIIKISANKKFFLNHKSESFLLLIHDHGKIITVNCKLDSQVISLDVLKRHLQSGIATITLFSQQGKPLSERRIFVQNYDGLNISLTTDRSVYEKKERINFMLNVKNRIDSAAVGNFSVSIANENSLKNPDDDDNINIYLLLTSDLKGYIEKPGYYFSTITPQKLKDLDLVMLTHGYSGFEWKNIDENKPALFVAEKGLEISGLLKNVLGKPVVNGSVTLIPDNGGTVLSTISDDKGAFRFSNLVFQDSTHFVLSAINKKGNNNIKLFFNRLQDKTDQNLPLETESQNLSLNKQMQTDFEKNTFLEKQITDRLSKNAIQLKEVQVKSVKLDNQYRTQSYAGAGNADQVMHAEEIEKIQGSMRTSLDGRLRGVVFGNSGKGPVPILTINQNGLTGVQPMLVIIDGAEVPPADFNNLTPNEVETVEVLKYAGTAIYGMAGGNGVLVITTKQGGGLKLKDISSTGILPITVEGFHVARKFYSPKYEANQLTSTTDLRSTIYWNPDLQTDANGNASFSCYTSDLKGNYRITVEGIDQNGNIGTKIIHDIPNLVIQ